MNRGGSVRVYSPMGNERLYTPMWFNPLTGGDEHDEATALGRLGDFGKPEALQPGAQPTFGVLLAKTLIEHVPLHHWHWRSAWPDIGEPASWIRRWSAVVANVSDELNGPHLPDLADYWGALKGDFGASEAEVLVQQRTLRVWVWHNNTIFEPNGDDPISKIVAAASLVQQ